MGISIFHIRAFMHSIGEKLNKSSILLGLLVCILVGCGAGAGVITPAAEEKGVLKGEIIVISLPEVRGGAKPPPSFYEAREIIIRSADTGEEIAVLTLDAAGDFSIPLKAGAYSVDITRLGIDRTDTPKEIVIRPGEVTEISIRVDTGLR
jgi:hypothetical protein